MTVSKRIKSLAEKFGKHQTKLDFLKSESEEQEQPRSKAGTPEQDSPESTSRRSRRESKWEKKKKCRIYIMCCETKKMSAGYDTSNFKNHIAVCRQRESEQKRANTYQPDLKLMLLQFSWLRVTQ